MKVIEEGTTNTKQLVKYIPTLQKRKWITTNTINHGGLHKQEEFKKGVEMLEYCAHNFRNPRLFHICFTGADSNTYQLVMIRFFRALAAEGVDYRYKGALEYDSKKGLHFHAMIVLGTEHQTHRFITSSDETGKIEGESALRKAVRHTWEDCCTLAYRVNPPQSRKPLAFIQFNQTNMEFFNEAVDWMSYIYKTRSKPQSGTVYFSDRQETRSLQK
jgi:hypothetical protein